MPKITNKEFKIAGKTYKCSVWYTATDKFFFKEFPKEIELVAEINQYGSSTEEELYERYRVGIEKYKDIISRTKKVIVFQMHVAQPHLENRFSKHRAENLYPIGVSDYHHTDMGFTIDYEIKLMRTVGNSYYLYSYDEDGNPKDNGSQVMNQRMYQIIDYTPEREEIFKELYLRFDKMVMAFINGFENAEKFIDTIQSTKLISQ